MDLISVLQREAAMLDLADRATRIAADRRRELRVLRFYVEQEFEIAVRSLLIGCDR